LIQIATVEARVLILPPTKADGIITLRVLAEAQQNNWLATGLIYIETGKPSLTEIYNLVDTPLNRLAEADLRPAANMIDTVNALMF